MCIALVRNSNVFFLRTVEADINGPCAVVECFSDPCADMHVCLVIPVQLKVLLVTSVQLEGFLT